MYPLIRAAYWLFSRLSLSSLQSIGRGTGSLMYYLLGSRRAVAYKNCEIVGVKNAKQVVKSSFRHTFCAYMETFYSEKIDQKFLDEMVDVEYLGEKPEGHRYFMVSAHFGAWELGSYMLTGKLGLKGAAVARKIKNKKVDDFIKNQRKNQDVQYIHHRGASEGIKQFMDRSLTIGVLLDHSSAEKDSLHVPFFGITTTFMKAVPLLSVRRDYPILPVFILRKEKGYRLIVYPVMMPDRSLKPKERAEDVARRINEVYEDVIKKYPDQWYLIHKRFKRTPGEDGRLSVNLYD